MMKAKGKQGFASMSRERNKAIATMGGKAAQAQGTAHRYTSEEARIAGKKSWDARLSRQLNLPLEPDE
jgi:uncharacterized protein